MKSRSLNNDELNFIKDNLDKLTIKEIIDHLNISIHFLYKILKDHELKKKYVIRDRVEKRENYKSWSKEETEFLKVNYENKTVKEIADELNRSFHSVKAKVKLLGLYK